MISDTGAAKKQAGAAVVDSAGIVAFIRSCLCSRWDETALEYAAAISEEAGFDWESVLETADINLVGPLLYAALKKQPFVPANIGQRLRETYLYWAKRNLYTLTVSDEAMDALSDAGIVFILLKGASLIDFVYEDISLRPLRDIDILIYKEDVPRSISVLAELGFVDEVPEVRDAVDFEFENEVFLAKRGSFHVYLELHWQLFNSTHHQEVIDIDWFWQSAETAEISQRRSQILGPEALLLHLCGHLILHHRGEGLLWWNDIAELIQVYGDRMDWELLFNKGQKYDLLQPLKEVLPVIATKWYVKITDDVLAALVALPTSAADRRITAESAEARRPVPRRFLADLRGLPGWRKRIVYGMSHLFPSASYMKSRYGFSRDMALPFAYLYRWWLGLVGVAKELF